MNIINPVQCGCGGKPKINNLVPYFHLRPVWKSQVICEKCHTQTDWYEDEEKDIAESKAIISWNKALSKDRYCYNCDSLEDQHYCLLYGIRVELGMSCDNWEMKNE